MPLIRSFLSALKLPKSSSRLCQERDPQLVIAALRQDCEPKAFRAGYYKALLQLSQKAINRELYADYRELEGACEPMYSLLT